MSIREEDERNRELQAADPEPASPEPDEVTAERVRTTAADGRGITRLGQTGLNLFNDWDGRGPAEACIAKHGRILYEADAVTGPAGGFVGTWSGGSIREIRYEFRGQLRFMYVLNKASLDDWAQDAWCTERRMTAHAAADTLERAGRLWHEEWRRELAAEQRPL